MKFYSTEDIWCARHVQNFLFFLHSSSSWQRNHYKYVRRQTINPEQNSKKNQKKHETFWHHRCSGTQDAGKICKHVTHPSLFDVKKIQIFLNCFAILFNLLFTDVHIYNSCLCHEHLECPNNMKKFTHLAHPRNFDPTIFQFF